jgi:hypothetical protein
MHSLTVLNAKTSAAAASGRRASLKCTPVDGFTWEGFV